MISNPDRLEIQIPVIVKPYDIDVVGVVSNIVYVRWLEDLRLAMLEAYLPLKQQMSEGICPAILKTEIEYKFPVRMHDEVLGRMWLSNLEKIRHEVSAEFLVGSRVVARGRQEGCFVNLQTQRLARPPQQLVAMWTQVHS